MQRDKALMPLSHDHFHGLLLAQLIRKGAPPYKNLPRELADKVRYTLDFYQKELKRHFSFEEDVLYPFVKGRDPVIDRMCLRMIEEHRRIEQLVEEIKKAEDPEDKMDSLGRLLEKHIRMEERELFARIQLLFSPEEIAKLG